MIRATTKTAVPAHRTAACAMEHLALQPANANQAITAPAVSALQLPLRSAALVPIAMMKIHLQPTPAPAASAYILTLAQEQMIIGVAPSAFVIVAMLTVMEVL